MKFEFTKEEAQVILESLVKEPYIRVRGLIDKLQEQASKQLKQTQNDEVNPI